MQLDFKITSVALLHLYVQALATEWSNQTNSAEAPSEMLLFTELVLDRNDNLCEMNRLPGENDVRLLFDLQLLINVDHNLTFLVLLT